jgi:hypothetical protein
VIETSFDPLSRLVGFNIYRSNGGELPLDEWMAVRGFEEDEKEALRKVVRDQGGDPAAWGTPVPQGAAEHRERQISGVPLPAGSSRGGVGEVSRPPGVIAKTP